ncbi:tetraspanin-1-like, partial [Clarias magur]
EKVETGDLAGVVAVIIGALVENKSEPIDGNLRYKDKSQIILLEFLHLANVGSLLIGIGSIITIIGFLGCCGAMFENKGMLMI